MWLVSVCRDSKTQPRLKINIDENKASALGVSLADINTAMQANFGSFYVNNFVHGNRVQRVIVELDAPYRMLPSDISKIYVRNSQGGMVSLSSLVTLQWTFGSPQLQRYNGFPSVEIVGSTPPGKSTGEAMKAMGAIISQLPKGVGFEWTGQSYEELLSGKQAPALFTLSLIVVFLALAALYESWSIPFAVMLVVPLGILGSLLAASLRGMPNDVYFKVGLLAIIGLSTKNAILIVEFAKDLQKEGKGLVEATLEAVYLASPSHFNDLAGFYFGGNTPGAEHRGRFGQSACHWDRCCGGHVYRDIPGYFLCTGILCGHTEHFYA